MAEFPKTESNVLTFTDVLCDRLSGSVVFPDPPVSIAALRSLRTNVQLDLARIVDLKGGLNESTDWRYAGISGFVTQQGR